MVQKEGRPVLTLLPGLAKFDIRDGDSVHFGRRKWSTEELEARMEAIRREIHAADCTGGSE